MKDIIVVTSGKGGVGKSTLSGLIGLYLSKNFKVLLIDADLGLTNLELIFNAIKSKFDISDVIKGRCELYQAINKIKTNLFLLNLCLSTEVNKYPEYLLESLIQEVKNDYDYVIVDSPAGIEQGFLNTLTIATKALIVLNNELTSFEDARKTLRVCKMHKINKIIFAMNKYNKKDTFKSEIYSNFNYYLSNQYLYLIKYCKGDIYKKQKILFQDKEFVKMIEKEIKINSLSIV
ncbi:MAG: AAA family ATPase [Bacilli bacterium]|nr:AAA family ATPase [Bacilli bacterium]